MGEFCLRILKVIFSLFFSSQKYTKAVIRQVSWFKFKRLLSHLSYFQHSIAGWKHKHNKPAKVVIRQPSHMLVSGVRYILALCGVLTLLSAILLSFNLNWRTQIALNLMPPKEELDALAEKTEQPIPQRVGLSVDTSASAQYEGRTAVFTDLKPIAQVVSDEPGLVRYIAKRYRIANTVTQQLVKAALDAGHEFNLDPLLILAVMAVESSFNPYAESGAGAQGLMQVMTRVHEDKYEPFGGTNVALHPPANIRVGARILKDCINRAGTLEGGLKFYVGATTATDGGYGARVIAERQRMRQASGTTRQASDTKQASSSTRQAGDTRQVSERVDPQKRKRHSVMPDSKFELAARPHYRFIAVPAFPLPSR